jgi:peptidoglycan hydrolase-like protein with peptidoglycan-binding domain
MNWHPTPKYRYATKQGMQGIEVWALQINLNNAGYHLLEDGDFGPKTDKAVRDYQSHHNMVVDGIAGVMTQRSLVISLAGGPTWEHNLPLGLLKSMASNESGFILAAYSDHPSDGGFDFGPYQLAFPPATVGDEEAYRKAASAEVMGEYVAVNSRKLKDQFRQDRFVKTEKYAWQLGALSHNWPFAAHNLATIGSIYPNAAKDNILQPWIVAASGGRLSTPAEWCTHYIAAATVYVTSWPE